MFGHLIKLVCLKYHQIQIHISMEASHNNSNNNNNNDKNKNNKGKQSDQQTQYTNEGVVRNGSRARGKAQQPYNS